jgi:rubrerythrin
MTDDMKQRIKDIKAIIQVATIALPKEREATRHYRNAARIAPGALSKRIFEELAEQEQQHQRKLEAIIMLLEEELKNLSS